MRNSVKGFALLTTALIAGGAYWALTPDAKAPEGQEYAYEYTAQNVGNPDYVSLDQGWDNVARDVFYHAPQGSPILPYDWFLALEQPGAQALFRKDEYLESFGLIPWGASPENPDGLPIGLTRDKGINGVEAKLGMNCGACHVTKVSVGDKQMLIDGGAAHFDFGRFMVALLDTMESTYADKEKFARFATMINGTSADAARNTELHQRFRGVLEHRRDWAIRNTMTVDPGPGRVDALNIILNQVSAYMIDRPDNARPVKAPVSLPFVWDAPYLDFVQYNAVVPNEGAGALGRNVGQVLGVFGEASIIPSAIPVGYASSVEINHLNDLETTMQSLNAPSWAEAASRGILPALDAEKLTAGAEIYATECAGCHRVIDPKNQGDLASVKVTKIPLAEIGTDPTAGMAFVEREANTGPLAGRKTGFIAGKPLCERVHANQLLAHMTVGVLLNQLGASKGPVLDSLGEEFSDSINGALGALEDRFSLRPHGSDKVEASDQQVIAQLRARGASEAEIVAALQARSHDKAALYKLLVDNALDTRTVDLECLEVLQDAVYRARPLDGIWATGPFLHNGSVPSIRELLLPANQRIKRFNVGSTELDIANVGFANVSGERTMLFDTALPGNSNAGHEYGTSLRADQVEALLEYIRSL